MSEQFHEEETFSATDRPELQLDTGASAEALDEPGEARLTKEISGRLGTLRLELTKGRLGVELSNGDQSGGLAFNSENPKFVVATQVALKAAEVAGAASAFWRARQAQSAARDAIEEAA